MASPPLPDSLIRETYRIYEKTGSQNKTAAALGLSRGAVQDRLRMYQARGLHLSEGGREAMQRVNLNGAEITGGWRHHFDPETGQKVETVRWSVPKQEIALDTFLEKIAAAFDNIPAAKPVKPPKSVMEDLCTVYCLADMHIGQLSWGRETGEPYDTDIAVARLRDWVGRLVSASPASKEAVILDVGDSTHMDDGTNQTPRSKHVLDVDGRYFRTIEETVAALSDAIDLTLVKHDKVTVVILEGNHSPHSSVAIMFALAERYRNEPRVHVRKEPGGFWAYKFGKNMLAATHGDKAKPERMVMFMADEFADIWGETSHRFLWTGHYHSAKMEDIGGVKHERLRAMTSRDAYAYSHAYVARSQLQAVTLHAETGELQRSYVGL